LKTYRNTFLMAIEDLGMIIAIIFITIIPIVLVYNFQLQIALSAILIGIIFVIGLFLAAKLRKNYSRWYPHYLVLNEDELIINRFLEKETIKISEITEINQINNGSTRFFPQPYEIKYRDKIMRLRIEHYKNLKHFIEELNNKRVNGKLYHNK